MITDRLLYIEPLLNDIHSVSPFLKQYKHPISKFPEPNGRSVGIVVTIMRAIWSVDLLISRSRDQMISWSVGAMIKRSYDQTIPWSNDLMIKRSHDQTISWSNDLMIKRSLDYTYQLIVTIRAHHDHIELTNTRHEEGIGEWSYRQCALGRGRERFYDLRSLDQQTLWSLAQRSSSAHDQGAHGIDQMSRSTHQCSPKSSNVMITKPHDIRSSASRYLTVQTLYNVMSTPCKDPLNKSSDYIQASSAKNLIVFR